jgi:hypothetical protein
MSSSRWPRVAVRALAYTRTTNARGAGFTYLFYAAIGICSELLMNHARGVDGDSAKLAHIGEYATDVRMTILLTLLECFSALVLAVALYGITRDVDQELAMLAMHVKSNGWGRCCGSATLFSNHEASSSRPDKSHRNCERDCER